MVKVVFLYGHPENKEAFEKYYFEEHLKLASKIQNTKKVEITKFVVSPDGSTRLETNRPVFFIPFSMLQPSKGK